jgi:DNA-binding protein HU-beta
MSTLNNSPGPASITKEKRMTKEEMIKDVAREACITQTAAAMALDRVRDIIVSEARDNRRVVLPGVGVFTVVKRVGRIGRNPQTGTPIKIQTKNAVKFKASEGFKREVNG